MNLIAHIESTIWAMLPTELDKMRAIATTGNINLDKALDNPDFLQKIQGDAPSALNTRGGERLAGTRYAVVRDDIAVIDVQGKMFTSGGLIEDFLAYYFGGTSTKKLALDIQSAVDNPGIKGIVLNINSPGGEAFGINELANLIYKSRAKKPIESYVSGYGASAALFTAVAAERVTVDPMAMLGSIGVVAGWADFTGAYEQMGIAYEEVTSENAPYKRLDIRKPEERAVFMSEINGMEKVFIDFVAKAVGVKRETVINDFGKGAVMAGHLAVKAGMVHRTGDLESVIAEMKRSLKKAAKVQMFGAEKTGEIKMSLSEKLKAFFASDEIKPLLEDGKEYALIESNNTDNQPAANTSSADLSAANARAEAAEKQLADLKTEQSQKQQKQIKSDAETFVATEISAGRMFPAEKEVYESLYVQAAADDAASPLAEGSRLGNLRTIQEKRKPHGLDKESLVPNAGLKNVPADDDPAAKLEQSGHDQALAYVGEITPNNPKLTAVK